MAFLNNTGLAIQISTIKAYVQSQISAATSVLNTSIAATIPTGTVQAFAGSVMPEGWLLCDGSAISRTTYAALFNTIGDTYGGGDGETTFNLPDLINKFIEGSTAAGTEKAAGLPNISGTFQPLEWSSSSSSGSFYNDNRARNIVSPGGGSTFGMVNESFDASRSSSIYGNSTTVQPPAVTMKYIIKY